MRLIDADALRQKIENWMNDADKGNLFSDSVESFAYDEVLSAIDVAPTIDPNIQRPIAHWIPQKEAFDLFECNRCHNARAIRENYCPHCGAVMIGEIENEQRI